jgi:hypothetical protein
MVMMMKSFGAVSPRAVRFSGGARHGLADEWVWIEAGSAPSQGAQRDVLL